jgi:hypothetical protein
LLFSTITLVSGKAKLSKEVLLLRQHDTPNSAGALIAIDGDKLNYFRRNNYSSYVVNIILPIINLQVNEEEQFLKLKTNFLEEILRFYDREIKSTSTQSNGLYSEILKVLKLALPKQLKILIARTLWRCGLSRSNIDNNIVPIDDIPLIFYLKVKNCCSKE